MTTHKKTDINEPQKDVVLSMSSYGYPLMTFYSVTRKHSIALELDVGQKQALVNDMQVGEGSPTELALLLKKIEVELKKINITKIVQQVTFEDWDAILKGLKLWVIVNENKEQGFVTAVCDVERFPEAVMIALGFQN